MIPVIEALRYISDAYNEAIKVVHAEEAMVERARRAVAQDVETWDDLNRWAASFYDLHVRHALTTAQYNMRFRGDVAKGREQQWKAAAALWLYAWWHTIMPNPYVTQYDMDMPATKSQKQVTVTINHCRGYDEIAGDLKNIREVRP